MKNPPHPGRSIRDACLNPLGLTFAGAAEIPGVAHHRLSGAPNGQAGVSPEMAIGVEKAGWSNADHRLRMQMACDPAQARRDESAIKVRRYDPQLAA
jgi:addiction module HigA family antidote